MGPDPGICFRVIFERLHVANLEVPRPEHGIIGTDPRNSVKSRAGA